MYPQSKGCSFYPLIGEGIVIANIETVEAINSVYITFSKWSLKLGELKYAHGLLRHNQDIQDTTNSNTLEMLSNLPKHGVQLDFEGLIKFVENFNRQNQGNRDKVDEESRRLELELAKEVSQATLEFERVSAEANLAVRKELELEIDERRYKELSDNAAISVRSEFSEFVSRIVKLSEHKP